MSWAVFPIEQFERFAARWDRINEASGSVPVLKSLFISNLLRAFGSGKELIVVRHSGSEDEAIGILCKRRNGVYETFQPSQAPLGAWVMNPNLNYEDAFVGLFRMLPGLTLLIGTTKQDPLYHRQPDTRACALEVVDYIRTGWVDVAGTFDDYWNSRSKQFRQNIRTQRSRLKAQGLEAKLDVIVDPVDVADAVVEYGCLESAGWKGSEGTAVHPNNVQGKFYRAVLEDFCRIGAGRIYRYRLDGRTVAMDLCIESSTAQILLKTAYDESIKGLSPASLMRQESYRAIFEERRIKTIEYYGRVMEWTTRWTDQSRTLFHVNGYRWWILCYLHARMRRALKWKRNDASQRQNSETDKA
ncbi:MAG: GNAT family N-acetyltransferase [Burkholderiales bacterium]